MRSKRNRLGGGAHRTIEGKSPARKKFSLLSRGGFETLEVRSLLAVDSLGVSSWTNANNRYDVNGNGNVEPADLLMLIDNINRIGARSLIASAQGGSSGGQLLGGSSGENQSKAEYLDVNGDSEVTPQDALLVINSLNNRDVESKQRADLDCSPERGILNSCDGARFAFPIRRPQL
jgi:hypothetical protein